MKVAVIDNGGQYAHRIYRTIQDLVVDFEVEVLILPNTTPLEELNTGAIAFSGSGLRLGEEDADPMGNCELYLDSFEGPILGMCAGHQLIAKHFGGEVAPAKTPEFGMTEIKLDKQGGVFEGVPPSFTAWNSHNDEVSALSNQLAVLAHSIDCPYEAIKHVSKPIYGLQFHPEVQHTEHGCLIFENFLKIALQKTL